MSKVFPHPFKSNTGISAWKESGVVHLSLNGNILREDDSPLEVAEMVDEFRVNRRLIPVKF